MDSLLLWLNRDFVCMQAREMRRKNALFGDKEMFAPSPQRLLQKAMLLRARAQPRPQGGFELFAQEREPLALESKAPRKDGEAMLQGLECVLRLNPAATKGLRQVVMQAIEAQEPFL